MTNVFYDKHPQYVNYDKCHLSLVLWEMSLWETSLLQPSLWQALSCHNQQTSKYKCNIFRRTSPRGVQQQLSFSANCDPIKIAFVQLFWSLPRSFPFFISHWKKERNVSSKVVSFSRFLAQEKGEEADWEFILIAKEKKI